MAEYAYIYDLWKQESDEEKNDTYKQSDFELIDIMDSKIYKLKLREYLNEEDINFSCIMNGFDGVQLKYSSFLKNDKDLDIIALYSAQIPIPILNLKSIQLVSRVRVRAFVGSLAGYEDHDITDKEDDTIVYVTETGTVYHLSKNCTHLNLSIQESQVSNINDLRNIYGGKYKKCEICIHSDINLGLVYITTTGDRYHQLLSCSGLKRTIIEILLSNVGGRRMCSRCGN